jgi:glucose-6-phosphate 1-dehydrogenase
MEKITPIKPTILVIVGISGDLARRKLLPALRKIEKAGMLPDDFRIIGVSRRDLKAADLLPKNDPLKKYFESFQMDLAEPASYASLRERIKAAEGRWKNAGQKLFYLSVPPHAVLPVVTNLGQAGLAEDGKLLLEKPFGADLASARELIGGIGKYFSEDKIFRTDHYLAKEMTQNLVVFRKENSLFRRTWNRNFIERIKIVVLEKIGIEGRAAFYEQTGALRDVVQSHLLQLAALVTMHLPSGDDWTAIPEARAKALERLAVKTDVKGFVAKRGQYTGYRDEVKNSKSTVETFAAITLASSDHDWLDVPIELVTGKALGQKTAEVRIFYRQEDTREANELVLRVGENEGVGVSLWTKRPGYDHATEKHPLDFSYNNHYAELPEAYERVFVDAMRSDRSLFASGREVLAAWKILEPLRAHWENDDSGLVFYEPGAPPPLL